MSAASPNKTSDTSLVVIVDDDVAAFIDASEIGDINAYVNQLLETESKRARVALKAPGDTPEDADAEMRAVIADTPDTSVSPE
ncbi:MAG: hypothetical protein VKJ04_07650 [Vampirovibrionales bacterium]|nr:hypothetical protein [Vampirovibrionales bacterium]